MHWRRRCDSRKFTTLCRGTGDQCGCTIRLESILVCPLNSGSTCSLTTRIAENSGVGKTLRTSSRCRRPVLEEPVSPYLHPGNLNDTIRVLQLLTESAL